MSVVKIPQEKKRLSYAKDHVVRGGENDKAFRRKWPLKKAKSKRAQRRRVAAALSTPQTLNFDEVGASTIIIARPEIVKWGAMSLREAVVKKQARQDYRSKGDNIIKGG